jgi:hypothetical protein
MIAYPHPLTSGPRFAIKAGSAIKAIDAAMRFGGNQPQKW